MYPPHVAARAVKPDFFGADRSNERGERIRQGMDFLWRLIRYCLSSGNPGSELQGDVFEGQTAPSETDEDKSVAGSEVGSDEVNTKLSEMNNQSASAYNRLPHQETYDVTDWLDSKSSSNSSSGSRSQVEGIQDCNESREDSNGDEVVEEKLDECEDAKMDSSDLGELEGVSYKRTGDRLEII